MHARVANIRFPSGVREEAVRVGSGLTAIMRILRSQRGFKGLPCRDVHLTAVEEFAGSATMGERRYGRASGDQQKVVLLRELESLRRVRALPACFQEYKNGG